MVLNIHYLGNGGKAFDVETLAMEDEIDIVDEERIYIATVLDRRGVDHKGCICPFEIGRAHV